MEKQVTVKMISEVVIIMIRNLSEQTETETIYKQQEILESVIKNLSERV
jgi:hypothetical protein